MVEEIRALKSDRALARTRSENMPTGRLCSVLRYNRIKATRLPRHDCVSIPGYVDLRTEDVHTEVLSNSGGASGFPRELHANVSVRLHLGPID